jgi:hypothetical protein
MQSVIFKQAARGRAGTTFKALFNTSLPAISAPKFFMVEKTSSQNFFMQMPKTMFS